MIDGIPVKKYSGPDRAPQLPEKDPHDLYIENSERLKVAAIYGDHETMSRVLKNRANPCYADEFGLTPLMMAAWNGHTHCVKFIIANDWGIAADRTKRKSINMQTIKGLTALHLFCQDGLPWAEETLYWLMYGGADPHIQDRDGMTPIDYVKERDKHVVESYMKVINQFINIEDRSDESAALKRRIEKDQDELNRLYAYHFDPLIMIEDLEVKFPVPGFIYEDQPGVGSLPKGMKIHEHQIKPLLEEGFSNMADLTDSLHCMQFTKGQATVNQKRREELVKLQDPEWKVPERPVPQPKRSKNRRKKGEVNLQATPPKAKDVDKIASNKHSMGYGR